VPTHAEIIQSLEEEAEKEKSKMYDPEQAHRDWELARSGMEYTKKMERDSWMVELPTGSSSLNFDLMQRHVTHFSRRGVADRDAGAGWTDDPEERRRKEAGLTAKTSIDIARAMARRKVEEDKAKKTKEIVEQYNEKFRTESLLDLHLEQKAKEQTEKEKNDSKDSNDSDNSSSEKEKKKKRQKIKKEKKEIQG